MQLIEDKTKPTFMQVDISTVVLTHSAVPVARDRYRMINHAEPQMSLAYTLKGNRLCIVYISRTTKVAVLEIFSDNDWNKV